MTLKRYQRHRLDSPCPALTKYCYNPSMKPDTSNFRPKGMWADGDAYEPYVGRWSRLVALPFTLDGSIPLMARAWAVRGFTGGRF